MCSAVELTFCTPPRWEGGVGVCELGQLTQLEDTANTGVRG